MNTATVEAAVSYLGIKNVRDSFSAAADVLGECRLRRPLPRPAYKELGNWRAAAAAYHSRSPELGEDYSRRVMQAWPLSGLYGLSAWSAEKIPPAYSLRNYTKSFLADSRLIGAPSRRSPVLAASTPQSRLGDQSCRVRLQRLAALGMAGG